MAYSSGFKAILTAVPYLLGMFIFSGISGRISDIGFKYRIASIPELFDRRFGKTAKLILSAMIAFTMMGTVASQVTATATIIKMLGGEIGISYEMGALIATVIFMVYTATSGLFGVVYTDVFQFYMLLLFVYILIPVSSLIKVGGFANFTANLDPALFKPYIDGNIVGDIVTYLVFTMAGAEMWQRAFAAKDRKSAKKGMFLGTAVYGLTIILVYFMGVVGHQILGEDVLATFGSTDAVAHVSLEDSIFNKRRALRRSPFVIVLEASPHAVHRSIVNGGKARLPNRFANLSAERAWITAHRFRLQRMSTGLVENHAAKAVAHDDRHLTAANVTGIEHAQYTLTTFRRKSLRSIIRQKFVTAQGARSLMRRQAFRTISCSHVHIHTQAPTRHF